MEWFRLLAGPVLGAVIGYCTNYIAVKMLFRPLHAVKIGNRTLPFTPGVIPKRQRALAAALGNAVGNNLVREEELKDALLSDEMTRLIVSGIADEIDSVVKSDQTVETFMQEFLGAELHEQKMEELKAYIAEKITAKFDSMDIGQMIVEQGREVLKEKVQGTMMAMFLSDETIASIAGPIGEKINTYITVEGREEITSFVGAEIERFSGQKVCAVTEGIVNEDALQNKIMEVYTRFISTKGLDIAKAIELTKIVEDKVNAMDVAELEKLVLSVMEKELGMIVNLGALIGFVIGMLNLLC